MKPLDLIAWCQEFAQAEADAKGLDMLSMTHEEHEKHLAAVMQKLHVMLETGEIDRDDLREQTPGGLRRSSLMRKPSWSSAATSTGSTATTDHFARA